MSGSTIPAALTALVTLWRATLPAVPVVKGPDYDPPANFLAVGWDRSDEPSVTSAMTLASASGLSGYESFDVASLLSFSYDANNIDRVLTDLFAAFDALDAAVAADRSLGGVVMLAQISDHSFTPILTESGAVADLRFTTHIEASK